MAQLSEMIVRDILGKTVQTGHLTIHTPDNREYSYGDKSTEPHATMVINDKKFFKDVLANPSLGVGEGYMTGTWDTPKEKLTDCVGILLQNHIQKRIEQERGPVRFLLWRGLALIASTRAKWAENIHRHYDLGNDFYEKWLSEDMGYTCGFQAHPGESSEDVQRNKNELVCRKIGLDRADENELDIADLGSGFGSFDRHAAQYYRAKVRAVTLSSEQCKKAKSMNLKEGLGIETLRGDYRDFPEDREYSSVVSIGMTEHVHDPIRGYGPLMEKTARLLKSDGTFLIHTIGSTDPPRQPLDAFCEKYIFPGARSPRLDELLKAAREAALRVVHFEDLKPHYAETLKRWRTAFDQKEKEIQALNPEKYNDEFIRMWRYYLASCEADFRYGDLRLYQILGYKGDRRPSRLQIDDFGDPSTGPRHLTPQR